MSFGKRIALDASALAKADDTASQPPRDDEPDTALDAYQKAAVLSLSSRNKKRAEEQKLADRVKRDARKQAEKQEQAKAGSAATLGVKVPTVKKTSSCKTPDEDAPPKPYIKLEPKAAAPTPKAAGPTGKATAAKSKPSSKPSASAVAAAPSSKSKARAPKRIPIMVSKKEADAMTPPHPLRDGSDPPPVDYNGGRIYTSNAKKAYRAIRTKGDYYSEKAFSWKKDKQPSKKLWLGALRSIDEYKKLKKAS